CNAAHLLLLRFGEICGGALERAAAGDTPETSSYSVVHRFLLYRGDHYQQSVFRHITAVVKRLHIGKLNVLKATGTACRRPSIRMAFDRRLEKDAQAARERRLLAALELGGERSALRFQGGFAQKQGAHALRFEAECEIEILGRQRVLKESGV